MLLLIFSNKQKNEMFTHDMCVNELRSWLQPLPALHFFTVYAQG